MRQGTNNFKCGWKNADGRSGLIPVFQLRNILMAKTVFDQHCYLAAPAILIDKSYSNVFLGDGRSVEVGVMEPEKKASPDRVSYSCDNRWGMLILECEKVFHE